MRINPCNEEKPEQGKSVHKKEELQSYYRCDMVPTCEVKITHDAQN